MKIVGFRLYNEMFYLIWISKIIFELYYSFFLVVMKNLIGWIRESFKFRMVFILGIGF